MMQWLTTLIRRARQTMPTAPDLFRLPYVLRTPTAGVYVDEDVAMSCAVVWACVKVIAETVGSLSWHVYKYRADGGRTLDTNLPLDRILHTRPNPEMSSQEFRQLAVAAAALWGNFTAEIQRDRSGRPMNLWPLSPDRVRIMRDEYGDLIYEYTNDTGQQSYLPGRDVYHVRNVGFNGIVGYSTIRMAREAIGLALATEKFGAAFFGNGARPGGILKHEKRLSKEAQQRLKESFMEEHGRPGKSGAPMVLEEGMTWETLSVPPEDAQFLQTRKLQVSEVCRFFRVPPHMVYELDRATFSNIEHQAIEFVMGTVLPWAMRLELEADAKLLGLQNRTTHFTKLNLASMLRGDIKSRYEAYRIGRQWGWLSADDIRLLEDMNPLPGGQGQIYLVPMNMTTAEDVVNPPQLEPEEPQTDEEEEQTEDEGAQTDNEEAPNRATPIRRGFRRVFDDAAARIARKEAKAVSRANARYEKDPQGFVTWADKFYGPHGDHFRYVVDALSAPVAAMVESSVGEMSPTIERHVRGMVERYATSHLSFSRDSVCDCPDVNEWALSWEDDAVPRIVTSMMDQTVAATIAAQTGAVQCQKTDEA